jgi:hypothetical protein
MTKRSITKPFPLVTLTLAAFPLFLLLAFLGYVIEARLRLDHWPSYANPDPKQLGWWIQHSALQLGFVGFPVVVLLAVGLSMLGRVRSREFPIRTVMATVVVASVAFVVFTQTDPGGFVDWFWD